MTTVTALPTQNPIKPPSLQALGLSSWQGWEQLPRGLTRERLALELDNADRSLEAADLRVFAVAMDGLFKFARAFGLTDADAAGVSSMTAIYQKTLHDLPADLILKAVARAQENWHWPKMPLPADLRAFVAPEFNERMIARLRIKSALRKADSELEQPRDTIAPEKWEEWRKKMGWSSKTPSPMVQGKDGDELLQVDPALKAAWDKISTENEV